MQHNLKCDSVPYQAIVSGAKKCEVRKDDRGFNVHDHLLLIECINGEPTGASALVGVTHIQRGYGLPDGIVVLSILPHYYWLVGDTWPIKFD
jgi:hypothetical protein